jgi:DnaJ-class molecular chaperone
MTILRLSINHESCSTWNYTIQANRVRSTSSNSFLVAFFIRLQSQLQTTISFQFGRLVVARTSAVKMKNLSATSRLAAVAACASSMNTADSSYSLASMVGDAGQQHRRSTATVSHSTVAHGNAVVDVSMTKDFVITPEKFPKRDFHGSVTGTSFPISWTTIPRGGGTRDNSDHDNADSQDKDETSRNNDGSKKSEVKAPRKKKKHSNNQQRKSSTLSEEEEHWSDVKDVKHNKKNRQNDKSKQDSLKSSAIVEEIMKHDDFYSILGVSTTATDRDITKAYRRRCVQTHPDKTGGDRRAFDRVAEAYDVLSDEQKRQMYNRFGNAGLVQYGLGGAAATAGSYQDVFRSMFQHAAQGRQQQLRRNASLRYQLQVTLEDLYHGKTQIVMVTPPPSFHHHYQSSRRKQKKVDVHIPKGSVTGQSIVLSGEVDFNDDFTPGDLIFVLNQATHPTFTRKGHDLAMELTIDLEEALCGMQRLILHLSGKELLIESARTAQGHPLVVRTGDVQVLKGWGMPKRNHNGEFGDLYVQFRVEMPKANQGNSLSGQELKDLSLLLNKLQGVNKKTAQHESARKQKNINKEAVKTSVHGQSDDTSLEDEQHMNSEEIHVLLEAKASDFGTASGKVVREEEDEVHGHDTGEGFHPFASAPSGFFGGNSGSTSGSYYFGNFGTHYDDDDGNVQCRQM